MFNCTKEQSTGNTKYTNVSLASCFALLGTKEWCQYLDYWSIDTSYKFTWFSIGWDIEIVSYDLTHSDSKVHNTEISIVMNILLHMLSAAIKLLHATEPRGR